MFEYIKGKIATLTPTTAVIETAGIGYVVNISLTTYTGLNGRDDIRLFLHQVVREDAHLLFGFLEPEERELFRLLISVSGIGASTAMMMLSAYPVAELREAILTENVNILKSIKGIGAKTAQRVIIELKDKVGKTGATGTVFAQADQTSREEAISALMMLGFQKKAIEKTLDAILKKEPTLSVEQLIKIALKNL